MMLPRITIERYLLDGIAPARCPLSSELQDIFWELRNLVCEATPEAVEDLHPYGITYYEPWRGGPVKGGVCQIGFFGDHLRLGFVHGAFLPDPDGLLVGERKAMRYVPLSFYDAVPWEALKDLIRASASFDPSTLAENQSPRTV